MRSLRFLKEIKFSAGIFLITMLLNSCETDYAAGDNPDDLIDLPGFPAFITPIQDYFVLQINGNHAIDSKIFFPARNDTLILGGNQKIAGAAYGSRRIASVEVTVFVKNPD
jgi:hypothetical protein